MYSFHIICQLYDVGLICVLEWPHDKAELAYMVSKI